MKYLFYLLPLAHRQAATPIVSIVLLLGLAACGTPSRNASEPKPTAEPVQAVERNLTFDNVTLEQADEQGRPLWSVKAKQAVYSKDQKVAQVQNPIGKLFQDGKPVYEITSQQGEIQQDGKRLLLKGDIVATDPRNGLVLRGNELEWLPQSDLLIVRNQLTGTHKQVRAKAQSARVFSRDSRVELQGQVEAIATNPDLQMRTEELTWQVREQKLIGDRPVQIDRYQGKKITDRATGNSAEVNLKTEVAILKQDARLNVLEPPMQVTSNLLNWDLNAETVTSNQPVKIVHQQQQVTATAKRGRMDLQREVVYLNDDVQTISQRGQLLRSQALQWNLSTQQYEANGDVFYRQTEPPISFSGQKAAGKLEDQNLVVSGGRVVTEIVPQEKNEL